MKRVFSLVLITILLASFALAQDLDLPPPPGPPGATEYPGPNGEDLDFDDETTPEEAPQAITTTSTSSRIPSEQDCALYVQGAVNECNRALAAEPQGFLVPTFLFAAMVVLFLVSALLNIYLALKSRITCSAQADNLAAHYFLHWKNQMIPLLQQQGVQWSDFMNAIKKMR